MADLTIRSATREDQNAIRALVFSVLDEYDIDPAPKTTDRDLYDVEGFYADGMFAVLESEEGEIVGTVGLAPLEQPGACELRKMYLIPRYRGRGCGARLLKHAFAQAEALGFTRIELSTARIMEEAVGLYLKFGFDFIEAGPADRRADRALYFEF